MAVVAVVANRPCCRQVTRKAGKMPPAMLARAGGRVAEATTTLTMTTAMLGHAGIGDIAVQEVLGEKTRLQRLKKGRR